ncbi:hypothetical protein ACJJTC_013803 [Scirpophaga incertulas]
MVKLIVETELRSLNTVTNSIRKEIWENWAKEAKNIYYIPYHVVGGKVIQASGLFQNRLITRRRLLAISTNNKRKSSTSSEGSDCGVKIQKQLKRNRPLPESFKSFSDANVTAESCLDWLRNSSSPCDLVAAKWVATFELRSKILSEGSHEEKRHLAMCAAMAHIKKQDIEDAWLHIMEDAPQNEAVTKFNDYFVAQWLENTSIQFIWNVHEARHRTINLTEAWHKRLNNKIGKRKPKMLHFLDVLKKESEFINWKLQNFRFDIPLKLRTRRSVAFDKALKTILDNYDNMSLAEVLKKLSFMQHFKSM